MYIKNQFSDFRLLTQNPPVLGFFRFFFFFRSANWLITFYLDSFRKNGGNFYNWNFYFGLESIFKFYICCKKKHVNEYFFRFPLLDLCQLKKLQWKCSLRFVLICTGEELQGPPPKKIKSICRCHVKSPLYIFKQKYGYIFINNF